MNQLALTLFINKNMQRKVPGYYIYRSWEKKNGRPIIDGVYMQKREFGKTPPETSVLHLE